ncbi:MAG: cation transporter [Chitinophagales bacterium]|nr:cation transporter [Chitinophagaceae bacterium]MCB9064422.1 cation transporter [Chitinophagales bacterium]
MRKTAIKTQRYIVILSIVLFAGKLFAWLITHSVTILTDALESTVNVIAGLIGLYSIILASKPRDIDHPYGHGKAEFISSAIEGALISIAGLVIVYEAVQQLIEPGEIHALDTGIYITAASGVLNFIAGAYAVNSGKKHKSLILESAGKHLRSDAYSTFAIVVGLVALWITGWIWLDSVVALIFAFVIIFTGYKVIRKSLTGIMDEADMKMLDDVIDLLQEKRKDDWIDLHNLRVLSQGGWMHVDAHLTLPWYYDVKKAEQEIHELEDMIAAGFDNKVDVFIHVDACQYYQCKLCRKADCNVRQQAFEQQLVWDIDNVWKDSKHGKE